MPLFGRRTHHTVGARTTTTRRRRFGRKDPDRVAGGYKAALSNPNTTSTGRRHAKHELKSMGRSSHVSLLTRMKRALGIRSTPRRHAHATTTTTTTRRTRY